MAKQLKDYVNVSSLVSEWIFKNLPYVFFVFFLILVFIANNNFAEKQARKIQVLQREINDLKWRYNSAKADVMFSTKQSEVENMVAPFALRASNQRTKRIIVKESEGAR